MPGSKKESCPASGTVLATFSLLRAGLRSCLLLVFSPRCYRAALVRRSSVQSPAMSCSTATSPDWITKFSAGEFAPSFVGGSRWEQDFPVGEEAWLRIHYENGTAGSESGMFFAHRLEPADAYTVEMTFRLEPGFLYDETGKLITGLRGGVVTPGKKPNGRDGFSVERRGRSTETPWPTSTTLTSSCGAATATRIRSARSRAIVCITIRQELVLIYLPDIAVVNNVEFDHADIYADLDAVRLAFAALRRPGAEARAGAARRRQPRRRRAGRSGATVRVQTFGLGGRRWTGGPSRWCRVARHAVPCCGPGGAARRVRRCRCSARHNVRNALAAVPSPTRAGWMSRRSRRAWPVSPA